LATRLVRATRISAAVGACITAFSNAAIQRTRSESTLAGATFTAFTRVDENGVRRQITPSGAFPVYEKPRSAALARKSAIDISSSTASVVAAADLGGPVVPMRTTQFAVAGTSTRYTDRCGTGSLVGR